MKVISIIAVTETAEGVSGYTACIVQELKKCSELVAVVNENISVEIAEMLGEYTHSIVRISQTGLHHFYQAGLEYISGQDSYEADNILFVRNNFFGPFCGFDHIFGKAEEQLSTADVWSLADLSGGDRFGSIDPSFFSVSTRKNNITLFREYMNESLKKENKNDIKAVLNEFISSCGLKCGFLYDTDGYVHSNAQDVLRLITKGFPVLFTDTLAESYANTLTAAMSANIREAIEYISHNSAYDTGLIWEYAVKNTDPFELLSAMGNHFIVSEKSQGTLLPRTDTVMVFHAFYDDLFDESLSGLNEISKLCDVIITTTSQEKKDMLLEKIRAYEHLGKNKANVLVSTGNGRDMAGLLVAARPYLSQYKYVGFTHDKKSAHHSNLSGETFRTLISDNIIPSAEYAQNVISLFERNEHLGLLVPPPPEHGSYFAVIGRRWCENFEYYKKLCGKLGIPVNTTPESSAFALGTAFWCRYDALKDLFEYEWTHMDFPSEPLPLNGSVSHAIERCFPYAAKNNGFYCGMIYSEKMAAQFLNMREYMLTDIMTLMNSCISSEGKNLVEYKNAVSSAVKKPRKTACKSETGGVYRQHLFRRSIMRRIGQGLCADMIKKNSCARILVILHLFYMNSWKEIKEYLKNLSPYQYELVVTYTEEFADKNVLDDIRKFKHGAVLKKCRNLGYDIGSFTQVLSETDFSAYDIIFKLQSKGVKRPKIYIYGNYFKKRDWFLNLFEGCIGPITVHKTIDRLMNDDSVGLVAAKNLIVEDPSHKQNMVKAFMEQNGADVPEEYRFVSGSCFAVRSELMQPVADMGLMVSDYKPAGAEFSLAHKMERLICLVVLSQGYKFFGNKVMTLRRAFRKLSVDYYLRKKYSSDRLLDDKRFKLDDEFVYFCLEQRLVRKYEAVKIPLKDIRRIWDGKPIPLKECHPYKYLVQGDSSIYEEYCRLNRRDFNLDIMSENRFDELIDSIEQNGFDSHSAVVVNGDNILMDGQHRCCYMLYKYGEDYRIPCLRIYEASPIRQKLVSFCKSKLSDKNLERLKRIYHKIVG